MTNVCMQMSGLFRVPVFCAVSKTGTKFLQMFALMTNVGLIITVKTATAERFILVTLYFWLSINTAGSGTLELQSLSKEKCL